jgi:hypothetical protein
VNTVEVSRRGRGLIILDGSGTHGVYRILGCGKWGQKLGSIRVQVRYRVLECDARGVTIGYK